MNPWICRLIFELIGAPERIRTSDLCLRRATLYPAELRALWENQKTTYLVQMAATTLTDLIELS